MWINYKETSIYTYGKHGKEFLVKLVFGQKFFGRVSDKESVVVTVIWDSLNECFWEKETGLEIYRDDISEWWEEK